MEVSVKINGRKVKTNRFRTVLTASMEITVSHPEPDDPRDDSAPVSLDMDFIASDIQEGLESYFNEE